VSAYPPGLVVTRTVPDALAAYLAESSSHGSLTLASYGSHAGIENPRVRFKSSRVVPPLDRAIFTASSSRIPDQKKAVLRAFDTSAVAAVCAADRAGARAASLLVVARVTLPSGP